MSGARALDPEDAQELTALHREYDWWADREEAVVRDALAETDVAVGVSEGGTEERGRTTLAFED